LGEALALDAAWLFAALLIILVLTASGIAARRFVLERRGATVECGLRTRDSLWRLGVASYQGDEFCWYRVFGLSMRPQRSFSRRDLSVVSRRAASEAEVRILGSGRVVAECQVNGSGPVDLALADPALTGLLAWLEAAPPGSHLDAVR
jgi:hypothetical protein